MSNQLVLTPATVPSPIQPSSRSLAQVMTTPSIKLVAVGDSGVGKTCLFISHTIGTFPHDYVPLVFDAWTGAYELNGKPYHMSFWDTRRLEEHDFLRPRTYPGTDVVLLCFSLANPNSYENIRGMWYPEASEFCPNAAFALVGTKLDLRSDPEKPELIRNAGGRQLMPITRKQGLALAKDIGANKYLECSALTGEGVKEVFQEAAQAALDGPPPKKKSAWCHCVVV